MQTETYERQKKMGFIPKSAKASPRPAEMKAWKDIPEEEKAFQLRLMEVYAGFLEHTDTQFGKIVDELEGNEISLDEAVNAYERGSKLKNICQERLNEAKMKVEKIKDFDKDEI